MKDIIIIFPNHLVAEGLGAVLSNYEVNFVPTLTKRSLNEPAQLILNVPEEIVFHFCGLLAHVV